jgi:hypothetical protein
MSKEEREIRTGELFDTANGPMWRHHNVWVSPYAQSYIKEIALVFKIDENHVIGMIADQFVGEKCQMEHRLEHFNTVSLPNILKKGSKESRG